MFSAYITFTPFVKIDQFKPLHVSWGHAVAQLVEALRGFD
jgi:hypothetical protein